MLAEALKLPLFSEDFESNPYLSLSKTEPRPWTLLSQLFFMNQTATHQRQIRSGGLGGIQDHSVYEVHLAFDALYYDLGVFDAADMAMLDGLYELVTASLTPPDLIVYLAALPRTLVDRVAERGRGFESALSARFLGELARRKQALWDSQLSFRLLIFDTDLWDLRTEAGASRLIETVRGALSRL